MRLGLAAGRATQRGCRWESGAGSVGTGGCRASWRALVLGRWLFLSPLRLAFEGQHSCFGAFICLLTHLGFVLNKPSSA